MESEDFIPMESMLEVSLVEGGPQICTNEDIEEVAIDVSDTETDLTVPVEPRTETSTDEVVVDTPSQSAVSADNHVDEANIADVSPVKADAGSDKADTANLSTVDANCENKELTSLSTVNIKATEISEEEKAFYKEMFKDPTFIANVRLHCTACDRHLGMSVKTVIFSHRILRVLMCQRCYLFYGSGEFPQGEDGSDMFCRWCGQGGRLLCCSLCSNVFCEKCISRNFGTTELRKIKKADDWYCFACNLKSLWPARATCAELKQAVAELKRKSAEMKVRDGKAPGCVDLSKCCQSEIPIARSNKAKAMVVAEEPKKPLAMIQPLPKKKMLPTPGISSDVPVVTKQRPGYITIAADQILRETPSLQARPSPLLSSVKMGSFNYKPQDSLPSPPTVTKFVGTKKYSRVNKLTNVSQNGNITPVRISHSVGVTPHSNTFSLARTMPTVQTGGDHSRLMPNESNSHQQFMQVVSHGDQRPIFSTQNQPQFVQFKSSPQQQRMRITPQLQSIGMLPSYRVVEPTLQLPNTNRLAPNQVYTVPSSFISRVVSGGTELPQVPVQVFRPMKSPYCPPLVPLRKKIDVKAAPHYPAKSAEQSKGENKWFISSVEKFAGVSNVLWSRICQLKQTFADMEARGDLQGMKTTAGKLHRVLETAAEHMKSIDKNFSKEFYEWCKNGKNQLAQSSTASPEVIDITDDDHTIKLMADTPAEVIEVEISPDIISLERFSSSTDDVQCEGEISDVAGSPEKKNNKNESNNRNSTTHVRSAVLDHAYSTMDPLNAVNKTAEESDVTLDLDICCESDEDDHNGDGDTADQVEVLHSNEKDIWSAANYDSDSSLNEKLSQVMNLKQVPFSKVGDNISLNEVTGEIEPNYDCVLKSSPSIKPTSLLRANLLKDKVVTSQTDNPNEVLKSRCMENSISNVPKKNSVTVQTELSFSTTDLEKSKNMESERVSSKSESVDELTSQKPAKPWSNEFDSFLKKLDNDSSDVLSGASETVTVLSPPASKKSDSCLLEKPPPKETDVTAPEENEFSENQEGFKDSVNFKVTLLQKCKIILEKTKVPNNSSFQRSVRLRTKKENLDYVDTDSAVSKLLGFQRRLSVERQNTPAPESVKRKRLARDYSSIYLEPVAKKIKCDELATKYPEISRKVCIVKLERVGGQ